MSKATIVRQQESELPAALDLQFININTDYQAGSQPARRYSTLSTQKVNISSPIVFDDHQARDISERLMYNVWVERDRVNVSLPRKYFFLEPTDVFTLQDGEFSYTVRIIKRTESRNGGYQFECVSDYSPVYQQNKATTITVVIPQVPLVSSTSVAFLMDLPVLREADAGAGFYIPMAGQTSVWSGGAVYRSIDGGANYSLYSTAANAATIGHATTALPATDGTVAVLLDTGSLATTTSEAIAAGANLAAIQVAGGWEVFQFTTAVLQTPVGGETKDTYLLGGLVRGEFGTEWAMAGHLAGNAFVLLDTASVQREHITNVEIGTTIKYKILATGQSLGSAPTLDVLNYGVALKPYSPINLTATGLPGDATLTWTRRLRVGELVTDPENYEVEIWDSTYTTLKRTITGLTSPTATYTVAQQTADFGAAQNSVSFKVFEISPVAAVGRGYVARGASPTADPAEPTGGINAWTFDNYNNLTSDGYVP